MVDQIIGHMIELHIQASFSLWREGNVIPRRWGDPALIRWLKAPVSNHVAWLSVLPSFWVILLAEAIWGPTMMTHWHKLSESL